jgi:hypothetical protein
MEKARTMRIYSKLPPFLWDEFYLTASHLHVKTTTRTLKSKTPYEMWYGRKPDYSYMREIGCRAFVLIQNKHNPKIYERSIECVLIGYDAKSKTYRCYHRESKKVVSSYNVEFLESHHGHAPSNAIHKHDATTAPHPSPAITPPLTRMSDDDLEPPPSAGSIPAPAVEAPRTSTNLESADAPTSDQSNVHAQPPRRSNRLKTKDVTNATEPTRLERTVQGVKESANRVNQARQEQRPAFWDLVRQNEVFGPQSDDAINLAELCASAISDLCYVGKEPQEDLPNTWQEAQQSPDADKWLAAYQEELASLKAMKVYKLVPPSTVPPGQRIRKGKPVFRIKPDENGNPVRWKVRHVFKGFEQIYGRDYTKTTSPTARMESWRIILHIAACLDWDVQQIDVKTAFLYGLLPEDEVQFMEQPPGFEEHGKEDWVWRLERSLYGMKQSGCVWNQTLNEAMMSWGFTRLAPEYCVYYQKSVTGTTVAVIHVDDFLSASSSKEENESFKSQMRLKWEISDIGDARFCVGIAIKRNRDTRTIHLSQTGLIDKLTAQFGQSDANAVATPMEPGLKLTRPDLSALSEEERSYLQTLPYRSLIGGLIYLAIGTRPDIAYTVQQLSQFLDCYAFEHWNAAVRAVRYLKGTRTFWLTLGGRNLIKLLGFSDSDWANCPTTRKSVGGYSFTLGSGAISWSARKQKTVATSSCEAEYVAAFEAAKEALWIRQLLTAIDFKPDNAITIFCDNNAAKALSEDPLLHARVKHIDIKFHFLRECVLRGDITLQHIPSRDNIADIFTKPLERRKFEKLRSFLGLSKIT